MWPSKAVPEHVVGDLFDRLSAIYGQRFIDMWHQTDPALFRETWGLGLGTVTAAQIRRGVGACFRTKYAPTLPEFLELCNPPPKPSVAPTIAPHPCLTDDRPKVTAEGSKQADELKRIATAALESAKPDGVKWARKLLANAQRGQALHALQIEFATEAIRRWEQTHYQAEVVADATDERPRIVPSPHIYGEGA
jgi:hypothetical protein